MAQYRDGGQAGFQIGYDEMTFLGLGIQSKSQSWTDELQAVFSPLSMIIDSPSFTGFGATSIKGYLTEVHGTIAISFQEILTEICCRYLLFEDGYHTAIDTDQHAQLDQETLDDAYHFLGPSRKDFEDSSLRTWNISDGIADIMFAEPPASYGVLGAYDTALSKLSSLKSDVKSYEATHLGTDFTNLDNLIASLSSFIAEYRALDNSCMRSYEPGSFIDAASFSSLADAVVRSSGDRDLVIDEVVAAGERSQERFALLEEEWAQERLEQGFFDLITGALVVIGGAACIILTAGMATPFFVAGLIAGGAAITYGRFNMYEAGENIYYGATGNYWTPAKNIIRDTIFAAAFGQEGKQQAWDTFGAVAIASTAVVSLAAGVVSAASAATTAGTSVTRAIGVYGAKTAGSIAAGTLFGSGTRKAALYFGTSETVANTIGLVAGTAAGIGFGLGAEKLDKVHNLSGFHQKQPVDQTFTGRLHGKDSEIPNCRTEKIDYTKRDPADRVALRRSFDKSVRTQFIEKLNLLDDTTLRNAGLSDEGITAIRNGRVPNGYSVHHKLPLDDGGTNDLDNLILIKNKPYHQIVTNHQNISTRGLSPGESIKINWPIPYGSVDIRIHTIP